jgi:PAS domain S-box-containing protein
MLSLFQILLVLLAGALAGYVLAHRKSTDKPRTTTGGALRDDIYRISFEHAPIGIAHLSAAGQWLQANRRFAITLGYSHEELLRTPSFHSMIHADDRKHHVAQTKRLLAGEIFTFSAVRRIQMKDGRYGTFRVWMSASRRKPEFVECLIGEAESAPAALAPPPPAVAPVAEAAPAPALLDQLEDIAVVRCNTIGIITSCNRGVERLFGYRPEQMVGKARSMLYRDADVWVEKPTRDLKLAVAGKLYDFEDERVGANGVVFSARVTIFPDYEGAVVKGFAEVFRSSLRPESEDQRREREWLKQENAKSKLEIDRLTKEADKTGENARRVKQLGRANDELRREVEALRLENRKKEGVAQSLRDALEQMGVTDKELMNELKIITEALRKEMDRRRLAEQYLKEAEGELARTSAEWQQRLDELTRAQTESIAQAEEEEPISAVAPQDMPWRSFDEIGPAELFIAAGQQEKSGTLFIVSGTAEKKFFLSGGRIHSCASNATRLHLAELLIRNGIITEEQRGRAIDVSRETGIALGRILVIMNAVSEQQLITAMHQKIDEEVVELFTLTEGRSLFVEGEVPLMQMIPLRVDATLLIEKALAVPPRLHDALRAAEPVIAAESMPTKVAASFDRTPADTEARDVGIEHVASALVHPVETKLVASSPVHPTSEGAEAAVQLELVERPVAAETAPLPADTVTPGEETVVASRSGKSKKYHRSHCANAQKIAPDARQSFDSVASAEAAGYQPCKVCFR